MLPSFRLMIGFYPKICFYFSYTYNKKIQLQTFSLKVKIKESRNPRTGNPVTVISGITHNPQVIEKLAKKLKSACGAGGHIEGKTITIQGPHSEKITAMLTKEGYSVSS